MLRIVTHIERLLLTHDCVVIPKFGGFVLQTVSGVYQKDEHAFYPMRKEIVFNASLQHTDGLLSSSYMQVYEVDYKKAQQMLDEDVEELQNSLKHYRKVSLGKIGSFMLGEENQLIYQSGNAETFDIENYGLSMFHFPVLPVVQHQDEVDLLTHSKKKNTEIFYLPINRKFLRVIGASAAALALFLLVSTPVKDVNTSAYTASFVPSELVSKSSTQPIATPVEEVVEHVVEAKAEPAPVAPAKAPAAPAVKKKMYHIVIASLPDETKANEYLSKVDRATYKNAAIIVRDGKYRVYADKYDNREAAEAFIETIRQNEKHKDAWLFISR